jgi:hypothetical protein
MHPPADEEGGAHARERWGAAGQSRGLLTVDWDTAGAQWGAGGPGAAADDFDEDEIDDAELARQLGGVLCAEERGPRPAASSSAAAAAPGARPESFFGGVAQRSAARLLAWSGAGAGGPSAPPAAAFHALYASHAMAR